MDDIEDILDLTPAQQGMLYQTMSAPAPGLYVEQVSLALDGGQDEDVLRRAVGSLVDEAEALRSSFHLQNLDRPIQVVRRRLGPPWTVHRLTDRPACERAAALRDWLDHDRARPFDLSTAPLARFALVLMDEGDRRLIWTFHHLVLDGWSLSRALRGLLARAGDRTGAGAGAGARADTGAGERSPVPALRDYQVWLRAHDAAGAEPFWRQLLSGVSSAPPFGVVRPASGSSGSTRGYGESEVRLSSACAARLQAFARARQVSLSTVFQAAWALQLARDSGVADVVFGITVSGRPAELPRADEMIGMFINTLPLRVALPVERSLSDCLAAIQDQHAARRGAEHVSPLQIQQWSGLPPGQPLFETLLVFENYPVDAGQGGGLGLRAIEFSGGRTHYPLVLLVVPGDPILVRAVYKRERCDADTVARVLAAFEPLLDDMMSDASRPLAALLPPRVAPALSAMRQASVPPETADQAPTVEAIAAVSEPPRTATERELARIWMDVLSVPSVGRTDDFFDLGGHSLLAMQLLSRIRETFAMELTIVDLFTMTLTIEELARLVEGTAVPRG